MKIHFIEESDKWKINRDKRVISFVHLCSLIVIFTGVFWMIISLLIGAYLWFGLIIIVEALGLYALQLVRMKKLRKANLILLGASLLYFITVCTISMGSEISNSTTHYWFVAVSLVSYFLLIDEKPVVRDGVSLFSLSLVFLYHFKMMPAAELINLPAETLQIVSVIDLAAALVVIYIITRLFVLEITKAESALIKYSDKLDSLIENILPATIADRLKKEGQTFADYFPQCSVLFADIVDFTSWSEIRTPSEVVERLNKVFYRFDELSEKMNLTKIKTIGDAYMVAAGIPQSREDHATALVGFANEIHLIAAEFDDLKFRIGIHSGPVVAGIIGKTRIIYDLWGDTVNYASRLENAATPGGILISEVTYNLIKQNSLNLNYRTVTIKGKGEMKVYDL